MEWLFWVVCWAALTIHFNCTDDSACYHYKDDKEKSHVVELTDS